MKIHTITKLFVVCLSLAAAAPSMGAASGKTGPALEGAETRATTLEGRLADIKAMDKNSLSHAEKKLLRREVREIKKELAAMNGGIYLSVGAIILIALLLILLL